jgi:cytidylate kinase
VTISASFGAGGSRVAPAVAELLGVELLDRAIPARVAERLAVPLDDALAHDEALGDAIGRLASSFALLPELAGAMVQAGVLAGEDYRRETERLIREHAEDGAVILGRAGAVILRDDPRALHVRLDGPPERRVAHAMEAESLGRADAERLRKSGDRAREAYVRHFYGCDARDPALYHLVIDSTALPVAKVVDIIAAAAR